MLALLSQASQGLPLQVALHLLTSSDLQSAQLEGPQTWLHSWATEASHFGLQ
jgi:hypothetical protein